MANTNPTITYPRAMLELPASDVHVWTMPLDLNSAKLNALESCLSEAECERANRFRFDQHRRRFTAARGYLRNILGLYLEDDPANVKFRYGPRGKPALESGATANGSNLHFNLAHSEELAMLAVSRTGPVGIDLERVRVLEDAEELVTRFFCPAEAAAFRVLPPQLKPTAFFNLWTRKEAWLKATGEGIGHSLHRVQVSFLPGEPVKLLQMPADLGNAQEWSLLELVTWHGFTAALACWGAAPRVCYRTWEPGETNAVPGQSNGSPWPKQASRSPLFTASKAAQ